MHQNRVKQNERKKIRLVKLTFLQSITFDFTIVRYFDNKLTPTKWLHFLKKIQFNLRICVKSNSIRMKNNDDVKEMENVLVFYARVATFILCEGAKLLSLIR